ncbi:MAG: hypothetical protein WCG52_02345 [bacterium]
MNSGPINSRALTMIGMVLLGCLGAILAGRMVAQGSFKPLILGGTAFIAMVSLLGVGKSYWMLIPLSSTLTGSLAFLPLPFSVAELGILAAFGMFLVYTAFKRTKFTSSLDWLDFFLAINVAYIAFTYLKNPVGLNFMGSDVVGGRPYFSILIALLGYIVMRQADAPSKVLFWLPALIIFPNLIVGILNIVVQLVPGVGRLVFPIYTGISIEDVVAVQQSGPTDEGRLFSLGSLGITIIQALCSYFPPATFFHPSRFLGLGALALAYLLIGLSGFRSAIMASTAYVLISTVLRRRFKDLYILGFVGVVLALVLAGLNAGGVSLPFSIQRAFSFLPLGWSERVVQVAESSTDWRVKMWKEALTSNRIIADKIYGDGFGFSRADMNAWTTQLMTGSSGIIGASDEELFMIRGAFHSGPVSSIKYVGYIGLVLVFLLQTYFARHSWKLYRKVEGTKLAPMGIFVASWGVYTLFEFYFIFGAYNNYIVDVFLYAGFVKLTERSYSAMKSEKTAMREIDASHPISPQISLS